jgi:hypothetical protein
LQNYDPDSADAMMYEGYDHGEDIEVIRASPLFAQSTFARNSIDSMRLRETSTKMRIQCGYTSEDHVRQHAKRMGSRCLVTRTPYKKGVMGLSLDRSL